MSVAILLVFAAASSPRGVLAFAPPASSRLAASTSIAMSSRNDFYPPRPNSNSYSDERGWTDWDDDGAFDAGLPLSRQEPPPQQQGPRFPPAGSYPPPQQRPPQQPRSSSSELGAGERPFSRANDAYWSSRRYSRPIDTRPQSAWRTDAQKEYREGKFQREGEWPQKQVYRGYNKPSADGPVGRRASFGASVGTSVGALSVGNTDGIGRGDRFDRMGNGRGVPYGDRPTSGPPSPGSSPNSGRGEYNEGYNDVEGARRGRTEDFRRGSPRSAPKSSSNLPRLRGEEVGFGRRESSFDVTAAATKGTGFGGDVDYLERMREEQQLQREEGRWEQRSRGRRMGTSNVDYYGDSFNERGESRGMLDDLSSPRRNYMPPPPPPLAPPPLPPLPPMESRWKGRPGASVGEGYTPTFRRGSKSGGYSNVPKYGAEFAGASATQGQRRKDGAMARRGMPPKRETYETELRPGDYGRRRDVDSDRPPPPPWTPMAGGTPPPPPPRGEDFGRFASGAGYQYYDDRNRPPARPRGGESEPDAFGREAGGAFYQYYDRGPSSGPRGATGRSDGAANRRYARPRPPSTPDLAEYTEDGEDADDDYRGRRGTEPDSTSYDEARPGMRGGIDEGWGKFDRRSARERPDGSFDRRRRTSQASFGDGRSEFEEQSTRGSSFGREGLERNSFGRRYIDEGGEPEESLSTQQRVDWSFDRRRTLTQQSFGGTSSPSQFRDEGGGFEESLSSQQRADRSFDRRRTLSQQSFGDARDGDLSLEPRRLRPEEAREKPYESKLLSKVQQYPPAGRSSGSGKGKGGKSGQDLIDGIKKMADKILSPYAEDGSAFAVDRMMNRVNADVDKSISDEKRMIKALLADARGCLLADPAVRDMLGGAITLGKPLSKSASSTVVNDVTKSRLQLVIPIAGSEGEGRLRLAANQDEIERLELESEGRIVDVRLDRRRGPGDAVDVDAYTFPNPGEQ